MVSVNSRDRFICSEASKVNCMGYKYCYLVWKNSCSRIQTVGHCSLLCSIRWYCQASQRFWSLVEGVSHIGNLVWDRFYRRFGSNFIPIMLPIQQSIMDCFEFQQSKMSAKGQSHQRLEFLESLYLKQLIHLDPYLPFSSVGMRKMVGYSVLVQAWLLILLFAHSHTSHIYLPSSSLSILT